MTSDFTGSSMCSRAIHCRAPISECPVFSRTSDTGTVLIPFATRSAQPMYWRFIPGGRLAAFSWPGCACRRYLKAPVRVMVIGLSRRLSSDAASRPRA